MYRYTFLISRTGCLISLDLVILRDELKLRSNELLQYKHDHICLLGINLVLKNYLLEQFIYFT